MRGLPQDDSAGAESPQDVVSALLVKSLTSAGRSRGRQLALLLGVLVLAAAAFFVTHALRWISHPFQMAQWHLSLGRYYGYSAVATALGSVIVLVVALLHRASIRRRTRR